MRAIKIMLFSVLGATIAAIVALIITSNVERGPAHTFRLVPSVNATSSQLSSDAAALVRRLQSLGYSDAQSQVVGESISLTLYGSETEVKDALRGAIAPARFEVRPVECAAPPYSAVAHQKLSLQPASTVANRCSARYLMSAAALQIDPHTGMSKSPLIVPDPSLAGMPTTPAASDGQSEPALFPAGPSSGFAGERLFLGPAQVGNDGIASAGATRGGSNWNVNIALTTAGGLDLDALAKKQFHAYIAICVDGTVISAPLVQPTSTSFGSVGGTLKLSAAFTKNEALELADNLASPLSVPLKVG